MTHMKWFYEFRAFVKSPSPAEEPMACDVYLRSHREIGADEITRVVNDLSGLYLTQREFASELEDRLGKDVQVRTVTRFKTDGTMLPGDDEGEEWR